MSIASPPPRQRKTRGSAIGESCDEAIDELERRRVGHVAERLEGLERPQLPPDRLGHVLAARGRCGRARGWRSHRGSAGPGRPRDTRPRRARSRARALTRRPCRRRDASRPSRRVTLGARRCGCQAASRASRRAPCSVAWPSRIPGSSSTASRRRTPRRSRRLRLALAAGRGARRRRRGARVRRGRAGRLAAAERPGRLRRLHLRRAGEGPLRERATGCTSPSSPRRGSPRAARSSTSRAGPAGLRPRPPSRSTRSSRRSASSATSCSSTSAGRAARRRVACPQEHVRATDAGAVASYLRRCFAHLRRRGERLCTASAAADLERVRRALGYGRIDVYGSSYGATLAQFYLRRYPRSVRTATLDGASLPGSPVYELAARNAERALRLVVARCVAQPACRRAFPRHAGRAGPRARASTARAPTTSPRRSPCCCARPTMRRACRCSCTRRPWATAGRSRASSPLTWEPSSTRARACRCSGSRSAASRGPASTSPRRSARAAGASSPRRRGAREALPAGLRRRAAGPARGRALVVVPRAGPAAGRSRRSAGSAGQSARLARDVPQRPPRHRAAAWRTA